MRLNFCIKPILLAGFAVLLVACQFSNVQRDSVQTTLTSAAEFTSYQILMRTEIGSSETRYEYAWKQTNTLYGFDSRTSIAILDPTAGITEEQYLVGDMIYVLDMMRQWTGGDRAGVEPRWGNPLADPEKPGELYSLPISALVKQSRAVGQEVVNGVLTEHLIVTDTQTIVTLILAPSGVSGNQATTPQVDIWRATGDGTVIKYTVGGIERYRATYEVFNINAPVEIVPPAAAVAAVVEKERVKKSGQIEHPTCQECLFPVPPDAEVGYDFMSDGRFMTFYFPIGGLTAAETDAMYQVMLQEFGWQITQREASGTPNLSEYTYSVTDKNHKFTVTISTSDLGSERNQTQIAIIPDPPFPPPSAEYLVNTGQFEHTACRNCIFPAPPGSYVFPFMMSDRIMEVHCPETMTIEAAKTFYRTQLPQFGWQIDDTASSSDVYVVHKDEQIFHVWMFEVGDPTSVQVNISLEE